MCVPTDSNSDQSDTEDFQRPLSKQPRIEASVVNLDVADLARRRSSLTDSEKYDFYCDHFIPDINYKFPREGSRGFLYRYLRKYNWLVYSRQETLTSSLKNIRENVDTHHNKWFETVSKMCSSVGTTPSMPRTCGRQCHRTNTPASTPSEYFKRTITIPILDHFLVELDRRFSSHHQTAIQGLYLVPSVLVTNDL